MTKTRKQNKKREMTRSDAFLASFQSDALCRTLQALVLNGIEPGPEARSLLKSLRDEFVARATGRPCERIPDVTDATSGADLLVIAEVLRATDIAFLTPEEIEDRAAIGFAVPSRDTQ